MLEYKTFALVLLYFVLRCFASDIVELDIHNYFMVQTTFITMYKSLVTHPIQGLCMYFVRYIRVTLKIWGFCITSDVNSDIINGSGVGLGMRTPTE